VNIWVNHKPLNAVRLTADMLQKRADHFGIKSSQHHFLAYLKHYHLRAQATRIKARRMAHNWVHPAILEDPDMIEKMHENNRLGRLDDRRWRKKKKIEALKKRIEDGEEGVEDPDGVVTSDDDYEGDPPYDFHLSEEQVAKLPSLRCLWDRAAAPTAGEDGVFAEFPQDLEQHFSDRLFHIPRLLDFSNGGAVVEVNTNTCAADVKKTAAAAAEEGGAAEVQGAAPNAATAEGGAIKVGDEEIPVLRVADGKWTCDIPKAAQGLHAEELKGSTLKVPVDLSRKPGKPDGTPDPLIDDDQFRTLDSPWLVVHSGQCGSAAAAAK